MQLRKVAVEAAINERPSRHILGKGVEGVKRGKGVFSHLVAVGDATSWFPLDVRESDLLHSHGPGP